MWPLPIMIMFGGLAVTKWNQIKSELMEMVSIVNAIQNSKTLAISS